MTSIQRSALFFIAATCVAANAAYGILVWQLSGLLVILTLSICALLVSDRRALTSWVLVIGNPVVWLSNIQVSHWNYLLVVALALYVRAWETDGHNRVMRLCLLVSSLFVLSFPVLLPSEYFIGLVLFSWIAFRTFYSIRMWAASMAVLFLTSASVLISILLEFHAPSLIQAVLIFLGVTGIEYLYVTQRADFKIIKPSVGLLLLLCFASTAEPVYLTGASMFLLSYATLANGIVKLFSAGTVYAFGWFMLIFDFPAGMIALQSLVTGLSLPLAVALLRKIAQSNNTSSIVFAIGGDSASGKDTFARTLASILPANSSQEILGDDFHKWARGDVRYKTRTHLDPAANDLPRLSNVIRRLRNGQEVRLLGYDHATGRFSRREHLLPRRFLIVNGLHVASARLEISEPAIRIFLATSEELRVSAKLKRDVAQRGKTTKAVLEEIFERRVDSDLLAKEGLEHADLAFELSKDWMGELSLNDAELKVNYGSRVAPGSIEKISSFLAGIPGVAFTSEPDGCMRLTIKGSRLPANLLHSQLKTQLGNYNELRELGFRTSSWALASSIALIVCLGNLEEGNGVQWTA